MVFQRQLSKSFDIWLKKKERKTIIVRGARQVGKSTFVRELARTHGLRLLEINLEKNKGLNGIFQSLDVPLILRELSGIVGCSIKNEKKSLIFLDEIQATPAAIPALRYFYEEHPDLTIIAAGSLLEFTLKKHNFSMPVGRIEYRFMNPMTFEEYLQACNEQHLLKEIQTYDFSAIFSLSVHTKLINRLREYIVVGGMPEAVSEFVNSGDMSQIATVHRSILQTYQDDFPKYSKNKDEDLLRTVFNQVPRMIGKKVKYVNFSNQEKSREVKNAIDTLSLAQVISPVFHSDCNGFPLGAEIDENIYKLLFLDIGLLNTSLGMSWSTVNAIQDIHLVNEGPLAEQFIGQELQNQEGGLVKTSLFYWLRSKKKQNAEVDYVIGRNGRLVPIEVKSGKSGALRSLHLFVLEKKPLFAIRFDLNPPSVQKLDHHLPTSERVKYRLVSLPLYMAGQVERVIQMLI